MPRAEPTGHSWITYGSTPRVAAAPGGAVQPYIAATDLFVGQDAEVASDFTVTPLGTVLGALPVGVVVGGRMTRYACCDQASDVGTQAARAGQSVLVANSGIAYKGTSPANAQKVVISLPLTPANTSAFISYPSLPGETGGVNVLYPYGDVRRYGAKLDGVTDDRAAFAAADANATLGIGGVSRVIQPAGTAYIGSNLTLVNPFRPQPGAKVRPAAVATITHQGDVHAGLYQWIDTSLGGKVTFAKGSVVSIQPHWWGPISAFSTTMTAMMAALSTGQTAWNPRVRMPSGDYTVNASVLGPNSLANIEFDGDGNRSTRIVWTGGVSGPVVKFTNARNVKFRRIGIFNSGVKPTYGLQFDKIAAGITATPMYCVAEECFFGGDGSNAASVGIGFTSSDASDANNEQSKMVRCEFYNCDRGIRYEHSNSLWHSVESCHFESCIAGISNYMGAGVSGGQWHATNCRFTVCTYPIELGPTRYPVIVSDCNGESNQWLLYTPDPITTGLGGATVRGGMWTVGNAQGVKWNSSVGDKTTTLLLEDVKILAPTGCALDFPGTDPVTVRGGSYNFGGAGANSLKFNGSVIWDHVSQFPHLNGFATSYGGASARLMVMQKGISGTSLVLGAINGTNQVDITGVSDDAVLLANYGVATQVNFLLGGYEGMKVTIIAQNGNLTIHRGSGINLTGGGIGSADFAMATSATLSLMYEGGNWYEVGRKT